MVALAHPDPAAPGSIPGIDKKISRWDEIVDIAKVNWQRCFLDNGQQRLENVNRTHLVQASGKPVLQKNPHKNTKFFLG